LKTSNEYISKFKEIYLMHYEHLVELSENVIYKFRLEVKRFKSQ